MKIRTLAVVALAVALAAGLYAAYTARAVQTAALAAARNWSGVEDEFRRRAEHATAIAATVEALNPGAKELAAKVLAAQASVLALPPDPAAPASKARFHAFMKVQDGLSNALGLVLDMLRLYPDRARLPEVRGVFDELELKETHIVVARTDYVAQARMLNSYLGNVPSSWIAGYVQPDAKPLVASFDPAKQ